MDSVKDNRQRRIAYTVSIAVIILLVLSTVLIGRSAIRSTEDAVHSVSLLYLNELAGRREQVVASNLRSNVRNLQTAVELMNETDLSDEEHLQNYQSQMKKLYELDKFAFVDTEGLIYTSSGIRNDIGEYSFDYRNITSAEISVMTYPDRKSVIIAIPVGPLEYEGRNLIVCFMEIDMHRMLEGVSLQSDGNNTTFCNLYTSDGTSLTDVILGGLASEDNLLAAMDHAQFKTGSKEQMNSDFAEGNTGTISFIYNDIQETMYYVPIEGTDWMLTYLIRESIISEQISSISRSILTRSMIMSVLTAAMLIAMFSIMIRQTRRNASLLLEKEKSETENRIKREELEQRIVLQEQLLEQEKQRAQQDDMITALASDYRSVYYVDLDEDSGICYRAEAGNNRKIQEGTRFPYLETFTRYAETYVAEANRSQFLQFIQPEAVRSALETDPVISFRYLYTDGEKERYELLRMAAVRQDAEDSTPHAVGISFSDIDRETKENLNRNQVLSDALHAAEEANKAKTAFLSSMSHEIRTPMNAIIGLDNIALADENLSPQTREHLEKIGSSAHHLLDIINDILDMSRIESGRMSLKSEEFSFSQLIEKINTIISGQCSEKGLHYHCSITGNVDDYYIGDDMKLRQVLINILGNAVKFTPKDGSIWFNIEKTAQFDNKTTMKFTVKDTGIGMDAEFLPKLFDAFTQEDSSSTNKYGSSGLGMAITKNLVEMMNGTIKAESEKGKGSVFTVVLTLDNTNQRCDAPAQINLHELNVLIVDDDPIALEHARLILKKNGIAPETAESGRKAAEMVRLRHARRNPYDLILIDWKMPDIDGIETARMIRSICGRESAIIILTAYKWDDIVEEAQEAGVDSFISKPLFISSVLDEYSKALRKRSASRPAKADLQGRRILLAEDVQINAEIMIMILGTRQIQTELAENGKIAVDMFESHPAGYYDAILMDMRMPVMDGLTAGSTIRALEREDAKRIPIIALTANAFDEDVQRSLQAGLNAHLSKPVDPDDLFETLESLIAEAENMH